MKKYLQIAIVSGLFFLIVFVKNNLPRAREDDVKTITVPPQVNTVNPTVGVVPSGTTYKDGTYTGSIEDVYYGNYQVQAVISGGKLTDVIFLQYPNDNRTSQYVNNTSMPILKSEAMTAQSAQVDSVSGASDSSIGFQRSLTAALAQAKQ